MNESAQTILVVDDDDVIRASVARSLEAAGYQAIEANCLADVEALLSLWDPALVILDLGLPDGCGLDLLRTIGRPVIIASGRTAETDRVVGLELGADDYVTKPFSTRELAARVGSVLRRAATAPTSGAEVDVSDDRVTFVDLTIDTASREVIGGGQLVAFTRIEFELLYWFARHPRQVFSKAAILSAVWGCDDGWVNEATVTEHVRRIRKKLQASTGQKWITTVWGVGYRFEPQARGVASDPESDQLANNLG